MPSHKQTHFRKVGAGEGVVIPDASTNADRDDFQIYRSGTDVLWWDGSLSTSMIQSGAGGGGSDLDGALNF